MPSSSDYTNLRRLKYMHQPDRKDLEYNCNGGSESYSNTNSFSNISVSDDIIVGGNIYFNKSNNINGNVNKFNSINGENIILNGEIEVNGNITLSGNIISNQISALNTTILDLSNQVNLLGKIVTCILHNGFPHSGNHHHHKKCDDESSHSSTNEDCVKKSKTDNDDGEENSDDENSDEEKLEQCFNSEYFIQQINKNRMAGCYIDKNENVPFDNTGNVTDFSTISLEGLSNILYRNQKMFPAKNILSCYENPSQGIIDVQGLQNMIYGGYPKMLYAPNYITCGKSSKKKCVKKYKCRSGSEDSDESGGDNHCSHSSSKSKSGCGKEARYEKYSGKTEKPIKINILGESTTIKVDCGLSYKCGDMITCVSIANPNDYFQGYVQYYDSSNGFMAISQIKFISGNIGKIEDIYSISLLTKRPDLDINIRRLNEIYGALFNIDLNAANNANVDLKSFLAFTNIIDLYKYFFDADITTEREFEYTDDYFNDKINFLYYQFFGDDTKVYDPTKRPDNPNGNKIVLSTLAIKVSQLYLYFFNQELKIKFGFQIIV